MRTKLFVVCVCLFIAMAVQAQEKRGVENRHELRVSVSDGLTLTMSNIFGMGLADAITGTKRSDEKSSGVFGVGYRYAVNRFRIGADLGFASISSKVMMSPDKIPSVRDRELNFLVLPVGEFTYFKRGVVELYASAAMGVDFSRTSETGLTDFGKKQAALHKSKFNTDFAYQINPIAIRVGSNRIGGFLETGLGYKGFVTAGVSVRF